jgi:SSS family solute:Na+ symporter
MIATLLSTISYITVPGELIKNGFGLMWGMLSFPVIFIIIGYLIIPRIMRHKITSGYELLEERFGPEMRQVAAGSPQR